MKSSANPRSTNNRSAFNSWDPADFSAPADAMDADLSGAVQAESEFESPLTKTVSLQENGAFTAFIETIKPPQNINESQEAGSDPQPGIEQTFGQTERMMGPVRSWLPRDLGERKHAQSVPDPIEMAAYKEKVIRETKTLVEKQVHEQVQQQAQEILIHARQQADGIVQQARMAAAKISEQARQEGVAAANAKVTGLLQTANSIVDETRNWRETMLSGSEAMVLEIIQEIARKLFGEGMELEPEILKKTFERALSEAKPLGKLRVSANPEDVAALGALWSEQQKAMTGQQLELIPNKEIQRGGCAIEGEFGSIDARVSTQLKLVTDTLTQVFVENNQPSKPFIQFDENAEG